MQISVFSIQIFLLKSLKFYLATFNILKLLIKGYVSCCENQQKTDRYLLTFIYDIKPLQLNVETDARTNTSSGKTIVWVAHSLWGAGHRLFTRLTAP